MLAFQALHRTPLVHLVARISLVISVLLLLIALVQRGRRQRRASGLSALVALDLFMASFTASCFYRSTDGAIRLFLIGVTVYMVTWTVKAFQIWHPAKRLPPRRLTGRRT